MPTEIILITFIALGFCTFAGTLYWADQQTRGLSRVGGAGRGLLPAP
jgi:hypothetical protein